MINLKPDEFVLTSLAGEGETPASEVLKTFDFDPDLCKITVGEHGELSIRQENHWISFLCASEFWRRVSLSK